MWYTVCTSVSDSTATQQICTCWMLSQCRIIGAQDADAQVVEALCEAAALTW